MSHSMTVCSIWLDSSPVRYSSSPTRNVPTSSSGLFVDQSGHASGISLTPRVSTRRGDIHSDAFASTPAQRRRIFVGEDGMPVGELASEATFSNLNPDTSEADALGGASTRVIWGTNISISDCMSTFKSFLYNYAKKYRMWADGATEEETEAMAGLADAREYIDMMNQMRQLGVSGLNLDARNLKAYPATLKLWHQLHAYPQEIIPLMDQTIKDVMIELATKEMEVLRREASTTAPPPTGRHGSSLPPLPSSELGSDSAPILAP